MNGCIDISVRRVGGVLSATLKRQGKGVSAQATREGKGMSFLTKVMNEMMTFDGERIGDPLSFRCGLVCSTGSDFYLQVPQESIWLLPENDFSQDVVVYSNVTWVIE